MKLKKIVIKKTNLVDWFFNTGDDQSQEVLKIELAKSVIESLLNGETFVMKPEDVLRDWCADIGMLRVSFCEGFDSDDDREIDDLDLDDDWELELI